MTNPEYKPEPEIYPPPYELGILAALDRRYFGADYRARLPEPEGGWDPPLRTHRDPDAAEDFKMIADLIHLGDLDQI